MFGSMCFFSNFYFIALSSLLLTYNAVRCFILPMQSDEATNILRGVSADDVNWYKILNHTLQVDEKFRNQYVANMLNTVGLPGPEIKAQPILKHLMTRSGSTRSELNFGVNIVGMALSCQFMNTIVIHSTFLSVYANRETANVPSIRAYMSKIQMALSGYIDKLAAVDQPINHLMELNDIMNAVFDQHENNEAIEKQVFVDCLNQVIEFIKSNLAVRCGTTNDEEIVKTVNVNSFDDEIFKDKDIIEDFQLLAMIENLDNYSFVKFEGLGPEFWMDRLKIKPYTIQEEEILENQVD